MAWMSLSLHHFRWFCQSSSPPDRCWLVHLLVLIEFIIMLAFRAMVIETTSCPSWLVWRDRLLHRITIFWVLWVLRLQSRHIPLPFCTFSNRYTAFCSIQRESFFSRIYLWKILRAFASKFSPVLHRLSFVPSSYSHLNTRFLEIEFCTLHILLSFHNRSKIDTRQPWMSFRPEMLISHSVYIKLHSTFLPKIDIGLFTIGLRDLSINNIWCALLLAK